MNKTMKKLLFLSLLAVSIAACSRRSDGGDTRLKSAADSVAYVIGMNVGLNLQRMDSTLNVAALCEGIRDVFREKTRFTTDEAEAFYLRYMNYTLPEEARAYEERFLADIADRNRSYARTKSGVTYSVEQIGDQERIPASERDSVLLRLRILRADGEPLYSSYDRGDTLRRMLRPEARRAGGPPPHRRGGAHHGLGPCRKGLWSRGRSVDGHRPEQHALLRDRARSAR